MSGSLPHAESDVDRAPARAFTIWILGATLALLLLVAAGNWFVDPNGMHGPRVLLADSPQEHARTEIADVIAAQEQPIDVLVLGSSTARNVSPDIVEDATGRATVNASLSAGRVEEALAIWRRASRMRSAGSPAPTPVLLVDVDAMFTPVAPSGGLRSTPELWRELDVSTRMELARRTYAQLVSIDTVRASIRVLQARRAGASRGEGWTAPRRSAQARPQLGADGFRLVDPIANGRTSAVAARRAQIARYAGRTYEDASTGMSLDPVELGLIDDLTTEAAQSGAPAVLVLMPSHPAFDSAFEPVRSERLALLRRKLRRLAGASDVRVVDMASGSQCRVDSGSFLDGLHLDVATSSDLVIRAISEHGNACQTSATGER